MKKILNILLFSLLAVFFMVACDKDDDKDNYTPEAAVKATFDRMYPNTKRVEWEVKMNYAVADFVSGGNEMDAWFDMDGTWLLTSTELTSSALPKAVLQAIAESQYAGWRIEDVDYLERKDLESVYVVEVENGEMEYDLYYSVDGRLLKEVTDGSNDYQPVPTPINPDILKVVNAKYPSAKILEIDVEPTFIEVDLVEDNLYFTMILDKEYNWVQSEYEEEWIRVPEAVKMSFTTDGFMFNITEDDVEKILRPETTVYRIELDREPNDLILYYTSEGVRLQ